MKRQKTLVGSAIVLTLGIVILCVVVLGHFGYLNDNVPSIFVVFKQKFLPKPEINVDPQAINAGVQSTWLTQAVKRIEKQEYEFTKKSEGVLQAPNRKQNLRVLFGDKGITLQPRVNSSKYKEKIDMAVKNSANVKSFLTDWRWQWQTRGFGRPGNIRLVESVEPDAKGSRVEYVRAQLTEWYENRPEGVEQGFDIRYKPEEVDLVPTSINKNSWVQIVSQPIEGLTPYLTSDGEKIAFLDLNQVVVLEYSKLLVKDARGKILPSEFRLENRAIVLSFSDQGAVYPVGIDPLITTPAWTAESDQANAGFGCSVASAGDVNGDGYGDVIIGAALYDNGEPNAGRAYVYHGSVAGLSATAAWIAERNVFTEFGKSVSSAGDVNGDGYGDVVIGGEFYTNGESQEGGAWVYYGGTSGLAAAPSWTGEGNQTNGNYGCSVASAGDINGDGYGDVIVGVKRYSNSESEEGRAYVYLGSISGLNAIAAWSAESNQANSQFGYSVASAGDVNGDGFSDVIIGAPMYSNGENAEGRAYVFLGSTSGLSVNPARTVESNLTNTYFSMAVASAGDVNGDGYSDVIVGAEQHHNGQSGEGGVWVYHGGASGIAATPAWAAEGNSNNALFGCSVSNAGDVNVDGFGDVIIGAYFYTNGENWEGRAYVFNGSTTGLGATPAWIAESNQTSAGFGYSVSCAGDVNGDGYGDVIIGAKYYDNGETDEGRVYVYYSSEAGLGINPKWSAESNQAGANLGYSVASAGDLNGDGYSDVVIGAPYYDTGLSNIGRAFIYCGKETGPSVNADQILDGAMTNEGFGWSVSTAGDCNGDGFGDLIIGAPQYSNGEMNEGRAYLYLGNIGGVSASPAWTKEGDFPNAQLGFCLASAGDVNGDGYNDILLSAPYYNNQGRVCLYSGNASGLGNNPLWYTDGGQAESQFGYSAASAGDVNGDGFGDVVIGAPLYDNGQTDEGRAFLYQGHAGGLSNTPAWSGEGDQTNAQFGHSVSSAGDVNGDGYSDVIVGANLYDGTQSNEGRVYVYHGEAGGLNTSFAWAAESGQNSAQFGSSVATAGDVDNDGYGDVVIGAYQFPNGRAYVYHGSSSGLASTAEWVGEGDQASSQYGYSVASAGDINGDGFGDVIVGAPQYDDGQADEGQVFLYGGNSGTGYTSLVRQLRPGDLSLIGPAGLASSSSVNRDFLVRLFARGSQGRTRAKIQVQVAALGQPISNGALFTQSEYTDTGLTGMDLSYTISGLNPMQAYHWRARLLYDPSQAGQGQLHSPWYKMAWGSLNGNADFRTGPIAPATPTPTAVLYPDNFRGQIIDERHFFVYPNPTRGVNVKFRFFLKESAEVRIKVYTPQGRFVWGKNGDYPVGWNELTWNASGMANGVYFYIGEAKNANVQEKITKKLGLIK